MDIRLKRAYDEPGEDDGVRVLVDRLWPRGVTKEAAKLDLWLKDVAPSPELRSAWHHDPDGHTPEHFEAFADDYRAELQSGVARQALTQLVELVTSVDRVTLVYGAKDREVNHVVVLRDAIEAAVAAR